MKLLVTIVLGSPCTANIHGSFSIVVIDVIEFIITTCAHLEYVSTKTTYILPTNCPTNCRCHLLHGYLSQSQGCSGAKAGRG